MRITSIELYHVSIPLPETFWPSWIAGYPQTHNRFTLAKLVTDDGIEGYAAGQSMGNERQGLGDLLGAYLLGTDPTDIDRVQDLLKQAGFLGWRNFWIEAACWDIMGKAEGKPVYELLGGTPRPIPVYLSTGEVHPPEQRVDELLAMMERGYRTAKLRVRSPDLAEDIRQIEVVRKGVGDDLTLGVDANQGWLVSIVDRVPAWDLKRATEFAAACHANGFSWLEEPLDWHDYDGLAALKKTSNVKIAGAELNHGWDEIKIMFEKDCFDIYQPDATFAGGIAQVKKVIDACAEHDRIYSPHTWTNGIGFHVNWNLALVDRQNRHPLEYPLEEPSWIPEFREGIIEPILPDANGMLPAFRKPGLGFEIDERRLRKYAKRFFKLSETGLKLRVIREKGIKAALEIKQRKEAPTSAEPAVGVDEQSPGGEIPGRVRSASSRLRAIFEGRPAWINALMVFCGYMTFIYLPWDLFVKPVAVDQEAWFGILVTGWAAKVAAIPHWAIYAAGTFGFWRMRSWMWPWAAVYTAQIAVGMLVWNLRELEGGRGWFAGVAAFIPFAALTYALWDARPRFRRSA
jgi:L-alanine-DL-glutamate epimerase-like enolase superfamily enzyme